MFEALLTIKPRTHDELALRRGRTLALLIVVIGVINLIPTVAQLLSNQPGFVVLGLATLGLLTAGYVANRIGRIALAVNLFLAHIVVTAVLATLAGGSTAPPIFFFSLVVVCAAAFGSPRMPLIWAGLLTLATLLLNQWFYGTPLPSTSELISPEGQTVPALAAFTLTSIFLLWLIAGASYLTTRLLFQVIEQSRTAIARAEAAQQALLQQQAQLEVQNRQLEATQQRLEALVNALQVPLVPLSDGVGLLPLVGPLDQGRMQAVERSTLHAAMGLRALVLDLSGASELNQQSAQPIARLCSGLKLLGVRSVLAGLNAEAALVLSQADLPLPPAVATVQDALRMLQPA